MVTTAVVSSDSGGSSTEVSCPLNAIVKQPACAAAISSSGLVPTPFSKRVEKLYCASCRVPLCVEIVPLPAFRLPCHFALALRSIDLLLWLFLEAVVQPCLRDLCRIHGIPFDAGSITAG